MPKQVYVFPGNINEIDLAEGIRSVLEPAVDTVYTFDQTAGTYVDVTNTANVIPDSVYVSSQAFYSTTDRSVVNNKFHHNGPLPTDSSGLPFIPFVRYISYSDYTYNVVKHDPTNSLGVTVVSSAVQTVVIPTDNSVAYTKVLWDTATSTTFIVIRDLVSSDTTSYAYQQVVALVNYDKTADTISIIQSIDDVAIREKFPVSNIFFYYDSTADQYTFYEILLGSGGSLEIRKITATQTGVIQTLEPLTITGSTYVPEFPDALSDPAALFLVTGLDIKRPWVELTSPLDANTNAFTLALLQSPILTTSTDAFEIASQLDLAFIRGQYSYDSATGTWTFTTSQEFLVPSLPKNLYNNNVEFLNNRKGIGEFTSFSTTLRSVSVPFHVKIYDIQGISAATELQVEAAIYHSQGSFAQSSTLEYYTYTSTGVSVLHNWETPVKPPDSQKIIEYMDIQIDYTDPPEILFATTGANILSFVLVNNQQILDNLAPLSGKYLYDISQASTKNNRYYIIHRTQTLHHYPYVFKAQRFPNLSKGIVIIADPDYGGIDAIPGTIAPLKDSILAGSALNTAAGGTITSVYKRDANGLEALSFWVRSGSTMYTTFTLQFERNLNPNSIAKYIYDNSNVDSIHVLLLRNFESIDVYFTSPLYASLTYTNTDAYSYPNPKKARISMKKAGYYNSVDAGAGKHIYFNAATAELVTNFVEDSNSQVLAPFIIRGYFTNGSDSWSIHKPVQLVTSDGQYGTLFSNYFVQSFIDSWTADYEDTIELSVGGSVYKYIVIGKITIDNSARVITVLEDVV